MVRVVENIGEVANNSPAILQKFCGIPQCIMYEGYAEYSLWHSN
jgi:hypothetical protein